MTPRGYAWLYLKDEIKHHGSRVAMMGLPLLLVAWVCFSVLIGQWVQVGVFLGSATLALTALALWMTFVDYWSDEQ